MTDLLTLTHEVGFSQCFDSDHLFGCFPYFLLVFGFIKVIRCTHYANICGHIRLCKG